MWGMSDENGIPYVLPMNFGYEEGIIYLHSAQEGHSISIIEKIQMYALPSVQTPPRLCGRMRKWLAVTGCAPIV